MLCSLKFVAEKQVGYNPEWGVVFCKQWGEEHNDWQKSYDDLLYSHLNESIEAIWEREQMTDQNQRLRDKFINFLSDKLDCVYPNGHLLCGGSSISTCGTQSSDLDLCYAIKVPEQLRTPYSLPIENYSEKINQFIVDRMHKALRKHKEIKEIDSVNANVPIVKFKLNAQDVDPSEADAEFEFDINCNCVAGVYNAYFCDERLPKLAIVLKKWSKNVKLVEQGRFNSYLIVLLIVHYLQCGVNPPILPNLLKLMPEEYDGTKEPWNLTTAIDPNRLPERTNSMSVGALLCGFFRYYHQFDFNNYGILIRDSCIIDLRTNGRFDGRRGSMIFVEEPYDGLTVPKNIRAISDFEHIENEFKIGMYLTHPHNSNRLLPSRLETLLSRVIATNRPTRNRDVQQVLEQSSVAGSQPTQA